MDTIVWYWKIVTEIFNCETRTQLSEWSCAVLSFENCRSISSPQQKYKFWVIKYLNSNENVSDSVWIRLINDS